MCQHCLRRAQDVSGGGQLDIHFANPHAFAILQGLLAGVRHAFEACTHDGERFRCGERLAMARAGMVAMAMGDHRPRHGDRRIDVEVARLAVEAARRRIEPGARIEGTGRIVAY